MSAHQLKKEADDRLGAVVIGWESLSGNLNWSTLLLQVKMGSWKENWAMRQTLIQLS
jgi:hypothetical protein